MRSRRTIEAALDGMHFDRTAYFDGDITLLLAAPLPVDVEVNVAVEGDFMSTERFDYDFVLKAGEARLVIGPSDKAPADFRHFRITLDAGGFVASRSLGVEICHTGRQGTAPAALADRITETLDEVSEFSERDTVRAFARLASGRAGADTDAMIEEILPSIEDCHDCADFSLVPLIWARTVWGADIGEKTRTRIDQAILDYPLLDGRAGQRRAVVFLREPRAPVPYLGLSCRTPSCRIDVRALRP